MPEIYTKSGKLIIWEQEGGYVDSSIELGGDELAEEIVLFLEKLGFESDRMTGHCKPPGTWKLTLEMIGDDDHPKPRP